MPLWSLFILIPKELSFISFYLGEKPSREKFRRSKCFHNCFEFWVYFRLTAKIKSPLRSGVRSHFSVPCVGNWAGAVTGSVQGGGAVQAAAKRAPTVTLNHPSVASPGPNPSVDEQHGVGNKLGEKQTGGWPGSCLCLMSSFWNCSHFLFPPTWIIPAFSGDGNEPGPGYDKRFPWWLQLRPQAEPWMCHEKSWVLHHFPGYAGSREVKRSRFFLVP